MTARETSSSTSFCHHYFFLDAITDDLDCFALKRPRRHEKDEKKGNYFGGSKALQTTARALGEEYIVTVEEQAKKE